MGIGWSLVQERPREDSLNEVLRAYSYMRNTLNLLMCTERIQPAIMTLVQTELQRADKILDLFVGVIPDPDEEDEEIEPVSLGPDPYEEIARLKEQVEKLLDEKRIFQTLSLYQIGFHDGQAVSYANPQLWDAAENLLKKVYPTETKIKFGEGEISAVLVVPSAIMQLENAWKLFSRPQPPLTEEEYNRMLRLVQNYGNLSVFERDELKVLSTKKYGPSQFTKIEEEWMIVCVQNFLEREKQGRSNKQGKE